VSVDGLTHGTSVLAERLRVSVRPELSQEHGRALDVREEKRDRPGRKVGRHGYILALAAPEGGAVSPVRTTR
jgi:hypothetical protein